ncbi:MAG: hypothetical protein B7Z60_00820 [Ferrovum sp. 37-45-19]|jgi:hypothetical protein|uniref:hypothetical protein n=1 Tax=Ferrovum sp. JA12 TaxID=1356299 RepID=UPI0007025534|nr:hypothetical protein [Ferrovum sp. JA12]OYV79898.1 MAG: hypothetical protein B7Z65_04110 [Ferrovum sp. 21-44-67]OYV95523.1 MAG: hypothetical protein B7Z60_00820 [Ferrovum sp. 37-45-19]OZB31566.1 MAG: hypothetical protein B7X47_10015 [Ferrovum sp. 34-44-207]HQT81321.1 hypothetical protein [Ferrovaceae bacterium]KRH78209.1 hypothetical protein FERRO_11890 [Ferrovum sp. JA12]
MKHAKNKIVVFTLLLLSGCVMHPEKGEVVGKPVINSGEDKSQKNQEVKEVGGIWLQINQDEKNSNLVKQAMISHWLNHPEALTVSDRVRCVALLLLNTDSQSHLQAFKLLSTLTDSQQAEMLPIVDWLTSMAKNQIIEDSQIRDMTQQLAEGQTKINALQNKIKELKTLESNLLSKPSENH